MANEIAQQVTLKVDPNQSDAKFETDNKTYEKLVTGNTLAKNELAKEGNISCIYCRKLEVFLGFESGAIGLLGLNINEKLELTSSILISPHRVITDLKTKHVLTMLPIEAGNQCVKLVVGYYAKYI